MNFQSTTSSIALVISLIALSFAIRNFWRKSGTHVRGSFCISSSAYAEDKYVSSLTIENFKDRPVIIFKIFLRMGHNYYLELDDFESDPKILKSYEAYTSHYKPVDFYCANMSRIKLNTILNSKKVKPCIVLSTSHGKYVVKDWIRRWDPIFDFFENHFTTPILPMRSDDENGYYGADVKYLVKILTEDGYKKTIPVYATDNNYPRFQKFRLTEESLSSKESLENFLTEQAIEGRLNCVSIEIIDTEELRNKTYGDRFDKSFEAKYYNWFTYIVIGKLYTIASNIRLYFINLKHKRNKKSS